ncbi:hypothetical protein [Nocardioides okcheonensis]|uniref:hypothetical protein n=1 Tax=Nocardioides okcheonensis TaxID=2894081 RepID=UPI001E49603E|nr:hypothetical protein [Nocardioides okcheonensis]UFN44507.1 hypothetical protein LN652_21100 [Nocardioides okcheonensis]
MDEAQRDDARDAAPVRPVVPEPPARFAYTLREVAELVGVSEWSVRAAIYDGDLRARRATRRVGHDGQPTGRIVVLRTDLQVWLEAMQDYNDEWKRPKHERPAHRSNRRDVTLEGSAWEVARETGRLGLLTYREAAERLGRTSSEILTLVERRWLTDVRVNHRPYVNATELVALDR